jgi:glc operon protein GlcG
MRHLIAAAALLSLAIPAAAQTARPMLTYTSAAKIRDTCVAWASERKLAVAIAVYDEGGRLLTFAIMDGAASAVSDIAKWKGRSAATIHVASVDTAKWGSGPPEIASWEGGVPIFTADGVALGGVGASGAEGSEDAACGTAGVIAAGLKTSKQ